MRESDDLAAAAVVPVIVTWSADVAVNDEFIIGLSVNRGECLAYGSLLIPWLSIRGGSGAISTSHQWIVLPSDGLVQGANTFDLCGGGVNSNSDTINMGNNTLAVQIGK